MTGDGSDSTEFAFFIMGSCVSRDTFEADIADCMFDAYIARTSITSVGMRPVKGHVARRARAALQGQSRCSVIFNDLEQATFDKITVLSIQHELIDFVVECFNQFRSVVNLLSLPRQIQKSGYIT